MRARRFDYLGPLRNIRLQEHTELRQRGAYDHFIEQLDGYACFTFHPRADIGVDRAARLVMVEDLLGHVREKGKVEFKQCRDVALAR
jgi:hypothetical protein